jgi:hypothetical protein
MQGAGYEAVVLHRECPETKQMPQDQLACQGKICMHKIKMTTEINVIAMF